MYHSPGTFFLCKGLDCSGRKTQFYKIDISKLSLRAKDALKYLFINGKFLLLTLGSLKAQL